MTAADQENALASIASETGLKWRFHRERLETWVSHKPKCWVHLHRARLAKRLGSCSDAAGQLAQDKGRNCHMKSVVQVKTEDKTKLNGNVLGQVQSHFFPNNF